MILIRSRWYNLKKDQIATKSFWRKLSFVLTLLLCVSSITYAQGQFKITGKVVDAKGEPLPGVNIVEKGTTNGMITDFDGNYSFNASSGNVTIVFSFIGFKNQEIAVNGKSTINITLEDDTKQLDDVVVVGYGVQKKSDVTGAMTRVSSDELEVRPVSNALEAMQGQAAGVDITSSERPGELGSITIRGVRSLAGSNDKDLMKPLYVVDGIPLMSSSGIETINPRDIQSIDILKDASATAIYGSRGANGVIIVTTKKGKAGKFTINYTGTFTVENIKNKDPMMNASEYMTWRRWAYYWANWDSETETSTYNRGDDPDKTQDETIFKSGQDPYAWANIEKGWAGGTWDGSKVNSTDWTDYVTQNAITQEHSLSVSGGTDKMSAYGSFGYLNQQGTQLGQWYKRYTSKASVDLTPKKWFKMGATINASWSDQDYGMSTLGASSSSSPNSIYAAAEKIFAYAVPYDDEGEAILNPGGDDNIYTIIGEQDLSTQQRQTFRALGSFYAVVNFGDIYKPLEGLNFRVNFGPDFRYWREGVFIDAESVVEATNTQKSYARLKNQRDFSYTIDQMLTYNKKINQHALNFTLLHTASQYNVESSYMEGYNIPKSSYLWNNFGSLDVTDTDYSVGIGSGLTEKQLESYMGRVNYTFADKYIVTASGRYDGASQLSLGHKWAFFPSAALGWRLKQEAFLKNVNWIDQLKLRLGFGTTGNAAVSAYATKGEIQDFFVPFGDSDNEQAYAVNEASYSKNTMELACDDLGWEMTTQYNLGIDFSFIRGRIGGTLDAYTTTTSDLLMDMKIPVMTGYSNTYANIGETTNKGFDLSLNTLNVKAGAFQWRSTLNLGYNKDKIKKLAYGKNDMEDNGWFIGQPISVLRGYEGNGIWQKKDKEEMAKWDSSYGFQEGKARPVDQNGDYVIDSDDKVIIGNKRPKYTVGFNNTFEYKNLSLNVVTFGRLGYKIKGGNSQTGRYNQRKLDYWTPDHTNAEWQKPIYNESGGDTYYACIGWRDGGFIKLRTISLAYNLPKKLVNKWSIGNIKCYAQMKNVGMLYSTVDYKDLDTGGVTYNQGFVFGINADF